MEISVELSLMPLQDNFREGVIDFIKRLRSSKFKLIENSLSTQIFGEYDEVMSFLQKELKISFENNNHIIANFKIVKSNRSDYKPNF